jgi:hypothetical protein
MSQRVAHRQGSRDHAKAKPVNTAAQAAVRDAPPKPVIATPPKPATTNTCKAGTEGPRKFG